LVPIGFYDAIVVLLRILRHPFFFSTPPPPFPFFSYTPNGKVSSPLLLKLPGVHPFLLSCDFSFRLSGLSPIFLILKEITLPKFFSIFLTASNFERTSPNPGILFCLSFLPLWAVDHACVGALSAGIVLSRCDAFLSWKFPLDREILRE